MERFFGTLKDELLPLSQLKSTEQLLEVIALAMYYCNHRRRHSTLGNLSPAAYAASLMPGIPLRKRRDKVLQKKGA